MIKVGILLFSICLRYINPLFKSLMENFERSSTSSMSSIFTPPTKPAGTPIQPANNTTRISTMRPLATAYKASTSDYQVFSGKQKHVFLCCLPLAL